MTCLGLLQVLKSFLSTSYLNCVVAVFFYGLYLSDLAPINLGYGAWNDLSPFIPEVSHSDLVYKESRSLALTILRSSFLQLELRVDLILKRHEGVSLICLPVSVGHGKRVVIEDLCLVQVLITNLMELGDA